MEGEFDETCKKVRDVVEEIKKNVSYLKSMLVVQLCLKKCIPVLFVFVVMSQMIAAIFE